MNDQRSTAVSRDPDELLSFVLDLAKQLGATAADAQFVSGRSTSVKVRLAETEQIKQSRDKGIGLRVFVGDRSATTSSSDLGRQALASLVERTVAAARVTAADPFAGLPDASAFDDPTGVDLQLYDPGVEALDAPGALELVRATEAAALEVDPRLKNSEGAQMSWGYSVFHFANSLGIRRQRRSSSASFWTTPVAEHEGAKERDYWYSSARFLADLDSPQAVGQRAAARALRRLGARQPETCQVPVIFEAPAASRFLGTLAGAINGGAIYRDASYLCGKLGEAVASPAVTITDDPHIVRGAGSRAFDAEGLSTRPLTIVDRGVLQSWLLDTYAGRKLGMASTRGARRGLSSGPSPGVSNLWMAPGDQSLESLIGEVRRGLFVTDTFGFGVSTVTGDFSQGAVGLWIEDGKLAYPVNELTIAGRLGDMWTQIDGLADDRDPTKSTSAPSLRIARMTVAGA